MMWIVLPGILVGWLLLSVAASLVVGAVSRGGVREDRSRGYLVDR